MIVYRLWFLYILDKKNPEWYMVQRDCVCVCALCVSLFVWFGLWQHSYLSDPVQPVCRVQKWRVMWRDWRIHAFACASMQCMQSVKSRVYGIGLQCLPQHSRASAHRCMVRYSTAVSSGAQYSVGCAGSITRPRRLLSLRCCSTGPVLLGIASQSSQSL